MIPYNFLCDTKVLSSIRNLPYMVVGSSVSQKTCDKVFLNPHNYMVVGLLVSRKPCDKVFLNPHSYMVVHLSVISSGR